MSLDSLPVRSDFPACSFEVPLYPVHVAVIPCRPNQKRAERMRELLPALPWELVHAYNTPAHASVTTFEFDSPLPWLMLVTFEPDSSVGTVAHEVFHLTHRVMEFTRAEFSHEPYAYLYQWLFRTILMITHEHPDPECLIATEDKDAGNITWLNTEHDLGLTPLSVLNKTIEEHLQQTINQ